MWRKCLGILSRHTDRMSAALTDIVYHPVVDRQLLLIITHSILDDLVENLLCHVVGFFVLVAQSGRIVVQIGIGDLRGTADLILVHDLVAILLIGALLFCFLCLTRTLIIDELAHLCILACLRIHHPCTHAD